MPKQIRPAGMLYWLLLTSTTLGLGATDGYAQAAQERSLQLEEVLVTARKREESLQDTPISITAFSPQMLEQLGITAPNEVADFTPNLIADVKPATSIQATYAIRGFGQGESFAEPRVAVYLDGVYTGAGPSFDLVDLERIEVLRGPQGTLYGRNTVGGAINVITARPAEEFGFKQQLSFGNKDYWRTVTSIDVPVADTFQTKWTYLKTERDGWADNNFVGPGLEKEWEAVRLTFDGIAPRPGFRGIDAGAPEQLERGELVRACFYDRFRRDQSQATDIRKTLDRRRQQR